MSELQLIWLVSLALAAAALVWMTALILARLLRERADRRRAHDRAVIQQVWLDLLAGHGDAVGRLRQVRGRARLMAESLLEVVALVRGAERERLIATLQAFDVDSVFRRRLLRGSAAGRLAAAEALSIFPGEAGVAALRRALVATRSGELRVALMRSLSDLSAPPGLNEVLGDVRGRRASESLLYLPLLGRLVANRPMEGLQAFGDGGTVGPARVLLAEALGASGDFRVLQPLCFAAAAPDEELRIAAVRGLAALGHPAAEQAILAALDDPVWMVRAAACEAAGRIGLRSAIAALARQLDDSVWWVRFRAGEALAALGAPGRERLQAEALDGGELSRRTASMVLAERGLAAETV